MKHYSESKLKKNKKKLLVIPGFIPFVLLLSTHNVLRRGRKLQVTIYKKSVIHIKFIKKKLAPAQKKKSPFDRELLAMNEAIWHFRHMVEARNFSVITDHNPLTHAFRANNEKHSPRQFSI